MGSSSESEFYQWLATDIYLSGNSIRGQNNGIFYISDLLSFNQTNFSFAKLLTKKKRTDKTNKQAVRRTDSNIREKV